MTSENEITESQVESPVQDDLESRIPAPTTKQDLWERKLLDFTLRNSLINMRASSVLSFVSFDIDKLEDRLQQNVDIQIQHFPASPFPTTEKSGFFNSSDFCDLKHLVSSGVDSGCLYAYRKEKELKDQLKKLYRSSRVALEENGANTLFLNFGVVRWFETTTSDIPRYAPLVLIPVDILRKGGEIGYVLRLRDEEPIFNITLVEYLKQAYRVDISAIMPLPTDESGLDIRRIFDFVSSKISCLPRWELREEMNLGLFSFSKFVMWNDIHNHRHVIEQNPIIRSLIEGKVLVNDIPSQPASTFDSSINPCDIALPVDVDSSQMKAVVDSGNGRSFILFGPPGTGKSQTITNMIANALYRGKRVLFVAEKRAALEVVQSRLAKVGLAPFCLELHSNKVNKQHVLQQLQDATKVRHIAHNDEYDVTSESIKVQREKLSAYVRALHTKSDKGLSLHDCISRYLSIDGDFMPSFPVDLNAAEIESCAEQICELDTVFRLTGYPTKSPLALLSPKDTDIDTTDKIENLLGSLSTYTNDLRELHKILSEQYHFESSLQFYSLYDYLTAVDEIADVASCPSAALLELIDNSYELKSLKETVENGKQWAELALKLKVACKEQVFSLNAHDLLNEYQTIMAKNFIARFFSLKSFYRKLLIFYPELEKSGIEAFVFDLCKYADGKALVDGQASRLSSLFGDVVFTRVDAWEKMSETIAFAEKLTSTVKSIDQAAYAQNKQALLSVAGKWVEIHSATFGRIKALVESGHNFLKNVAALDTLTDSDEWHNGSLSDAMLIVKTWNDNKDGLRSWCQYTSRRKNLCDLGLEPVLSYMLENELSASAAASAFRKRVYKDYAKRFIASNKDLSMFNGLLFEQQIQKYRSLVNDFKQLTMKELYHRLASAIPSLTMEASTSSEVGILLRNISNGCRGNSIRNLIDQIPTLLPRLCPCMLMSPLSVAQYLDIEKQKFDLVIFDEASQMPTSEAVGAIARGDALVVVGDPKQMPPTSFFQVQQTEDEEADIDDLESILDDCRAISLPKHEMTWHYRSRHESLITFSNQQYYDGKLLTFPSVDNRDRKVRFIRVDGTYDMGKSRCNRKEAETIVKVALNLLRTRTGDAYRSLGIVSFSKVQQELIEDLLTDALDKDAELKAAANDVLEPVFVKNLENVQGDERDIILFSVGYGPDARGNVSMNFGPLNKKGGERRLNVAVSRARYEMMLFSTLMPEQIDPQRTSAEGVLGLRRFLEFARDGKPMSDDTLSQQGKGLVAAIAKQIESWGYKVDTMVGNSRFRVDLAVINPKQPTEYLLGILCDGENFSATPTNSDRNVVQPNVLTGLGWNILRMWSVDWYGNHHEACKTLKSALENAANGTFTSDYVLPKSNQPFSVEDDPAIEIETRTFQKKDIDQFMPWEIQEAIMITLKEQLALPEDELLNQVRKRLGFARLGVNVEREIRYNLETLYKQRKVITRQDGFIKVNE